jgi:thioredoxin-related protein
MIKGIYYLNEDDFCLKNTPNSNSNDKLLSIAEDPQLSQIRQGLTLVLFYSNQCEYCDKSLLVYKQLPQSLLGCNFSMINLNNNSKVIQMSKETINPITYVPEIILYYNSYPYLQYDGEHNVQDIKKFIIDISASLEESLTFVKQQQTQQQQHPQQQQQQNQQNRSIEVIKPYKKQTKKGLCYVKGDKIVCE